MPTVNTYVLDYSSKENQKLNWGIPKFNMSDGCEIWQSLLWKARHLPF